jgi:hypothetical protein
MSSGVRKHDKKYFDEKSSIIIVFSGVSWHKEPKNTKKIGAFSETSYKKCAYVQSSSAKVQFSITARNFCGDLSSNGLGFRA